MTDDQYKYTKLVGTGRTLSDENWNIFLHPSFLRGVNSPLDLKILPIQTV